MAVRANTASDRLYVNSSMSNPSGGITFATWFYLSADVNNYATLFRAQNSSGNTLFTLAMDTDGVTPAIFTPDPGGNIISGIQVPIGEWWYLAFTYQGSTLRLMLAEPDGTPHSFEDATVSVTGSAAQFCLFGRSDTDASEALNGRQQYARLWTDVLTDSELLIERAAADAVQTSNLYAHWELPNHTDLTDKSGNDRHLTAVAALGPDNTEDGPDLPVEAPLTFALTLPSLTADFQLGAEDPISFGLMLPALDAQFNLRPANPITANLMLPALQMKFADRPALRFILPRVISGAEQRAAFDAEMDFQRFNTWAFIEADPIDVALTPVNETITAGGGRRFDDSAERPVQRFRLIPMSHTERPIRSAITLGTSTGTARQHDFTLLGTWDAVIHKNDWWMDAEGNRYNVDALVPFNGYQQKALIMMHRNPDGS